MIAKTVGLVEPLHRTLHPLASQIVAAFIYGSIAKGSDTAGSDIDLLIVADDVEYPEVFTALQPAESRLGRSVNPNVMTKRGWQERRRQTDSFVARIAAQPRLFVIGTEDDIT